MAATRAITDGARGSLAALVVGLLLAACTQTSFERGEVDGCQSGLSDANKPGYDTLYRKDEARYAADEDYRVGWDEGYDECYWREYNHPTWESGLGGM